ncbi:uncharacterized protein LOC134774421 [Penaeus indicus]|uniref:uncharacterized protein LOC134774421 n=1 Tax=Penaeus indicus TaxID=29960 RepID=UPI00300CB24D
MGVWSDCVSHFLASAEPQIRHLLRSILSRGRRVPEYDRSLHSDLHTCALVLQIPCPNLFKHATEAGLSSSDINALIAREEDRHAKLTEREERQRERDLKRIEIEANEADKQRTHELELEKLKLDQKKSELRTDLAFPGLKIPIFIEGKDEIDDFLRRFERLAELQNWEWKNYHVYLGSVLTGRALKTYVSLPDEVLLNYTQLREALLKTYSVDAESYRRKFRESKVNDNETYVQLIARMEQYLNNWLSLSSIEGSYSKLCEFLIKDQLLSNCPSDLRVFLKEREFDSTLELAQAADRFRSAHKNFRSRRMLQSVDDNSNRSAKFSVTCHNCHKTGHIRPNCPELKIPIPKSFAHKVNFVSRTDMAPTNTVTSKGYVFNKSARIQFDSGCDTVIIKESLLPPNVRKGRLVAIADYLGFTRKFPKVRCYIRSKYLNGWVNAVAAPIKFTDVLIGLVPGVKAPAVDITDHIPNIVTTRTSKAMRVQTRRAKLEDNEPRSLVVPKIALEDVTKTDLVDEQNKCTTLNDVRLKVANKTLVAVKNRTIKFEKINDLIYRVCVKSKNEHEIGMKQLVIPSKFRPYILATAHDSSVAGHFSHRKTSEKIFYKFFWPGAGADIKRYCRSCPVCQKFSPKGKVRKVPLVSMPIISEPFTRVAIDLVGPLTSSNRGHKYILTLIDCATRFPEAVPLKNIDSVTVAENLINIFSRVGIPKEILSDRGTQFKSDLIKEVNRLLSIKAIFTSPYHAACNGTVERFHAVLKSMLRKLCTEQPREWDRLIPSVLFAYREIPNDTLKFSPFELLYGRKVRGPLSILYELWTNDQLDSETKNTYQYVLDLRKRLEESAQMAAAHAKVNSKLYKSYFDRSAKSRNFSEGDEVLVLLPSTHNKLTMQWKGPYTVSKRHENGVDYLVRVRNRIKLYHINMLKKFFRRESNNDTKSKICQICIVNDDQITNDVCDISVLENSPTKFNINQNLSNEQKQQMNELLLKYSDVFSDDPGLTKTITHDITLTNETPVHRKPYPLPFHLKKSFDEEVDRMLRLGVVEPSTSPYCSPVVLVKKADNTFRFCVDFRSLNDISLFDAEPMPTIDEALCNFVGDKYFSEIDMCKGYWQIPLSDRSKPYTAFATNRGLMQFTKMPFGLKTACATFVRLMRKVLVGLRNTECYFDNIVVHNSSWENHLIDLESLLKRLHEHGLTAGPRKCFIGYSNIKYLGFSLGNNCLSLIKDRVQAIVDMPLPKTKKQLRSFIGTVSFYRKFIPNLADILSPVNILLKKYNSNKLEWSDEQIRNINILKDKLACAPILTLPDFCKTFYLRSDASDTGLGAILLQDVDGILMPIAYASRMLLDREKKYAIIERECLSVVWAINKFRNYLYGREFILQTDHQPLAYLRKMKNENGRLMRWSLALQEYSFNIEYIKGNVNFGADVLSRCV